MKPCISYFDLQYLELCYFLFCKWCGGIQNRFEHQGLVISYLYIIPWQKSLRKVGLPVDWFLRHHMEPITELSLIFVKKKNPRSSLKWKVKIVHPLNSDWKGWQTMTILHEHLQARLLDSDFCQGCVEVRYHNTLTCEDGFNKEQLTCFFRCTWTKALYLYFD